MKKKNMLILLVLLLTVGFAAVSTTLVMNGSIGIAYKKSDFNVIFTSATVKGNNEVKATISGDKKTINFKTDKLSVVGDSAELIYKVKNDSTQYDANVIVSCTGGNAGYLNVVSEFAGKTLPLTEFEYMQAQEVRMGKISVSLTKAYDTSVTKTPITCTLEIEGEERDSIANPSTCEYSDGTVWTFDYTGGEQEFVVPCEGEYKLETWGAQGGNDVNIGGYGGYSIGEINVNKFDDIFINIGGQGTTGKTGDIVDGGYNGGGSTSIIATSYGSSGGGATHIATSSGLLSSLENNKATIIIVAGGGGGAVIDNSSNLTDGNGGAGGGFKGNNGTFSVNTSNVLLKDIYAGGGTQSKGGNGISNLNYKGDLYSSEDGSFGKGGSASRSSGGGGGGFYGGGGGIVNNDDSSGGGGSGYIGNPSLIKKSMYCYNCEESNEESTKTISTTCTNSTPTEKCSKQGNGYARITLVSAKYPKNEYKEGILNGAYPVIKEGLIPVTIENDGTVKKADIKTEWYKYEDKKWANAVILNNETKYYNDGDTIPESDIESYFVWIPKYKYKLWNLGNYSSAIESTPTTSKTQKIEIVFGTSNTENVEEVSCVTPMTSGATGECDVGEYMTPPAFISMNTNGIWVGKFETTGTTSNITIKPGIESLKNITIKTMFDTAYNYNRELDSHMMKNTEWGAVAYLSHSKYGINKEININNNSKYLTGYSAVEGTDQSSVPGTSGTDASVTLPYNTETGYLASTTGNITGVYDMAGGSFEQMASYMDGYGIKTSGNVVSGYNADELTTYAKYLDKYSNASNTTSYNNRILGDATGEIGQFYYYNDGDGATRYHNSWYADLSYFVDSINPWFHRGGYCGDGVLAGQFDFSRHSSDSSGYVGFRLVLA